MGILRNHLEESCDPRLIGELNYAVQEAYNFLNSLIEANPLLKHKEMRKSYGHIRQALVDLSLRIVLGSSTMPSEVQMLSASHNKNGYTYTMIESKGAIISPVKTRSRQAVPKKALHRSLGSIKNRQFTLFDDNTSLNSVYDENNPPFILLTYGGKNHTLEYVQLGLPDVEVEQWIEKVDITNATRLTIADTNPEATKKKLDLSLTELSEELLRRDNNGTTRNI
ncbi:TPA: hypothetical protein ACIN9P_001974 [Streptococcus agalactiae]